MEALDHIRLNFSNEDLFLLNFALAFVMFGIALEIKFGHFKKISENPKSVVIGTISQFILLPFSTFILVIIFKSFLTPTMALGMILVAACPGGNISNFISSIARANVVLSVSLTAISTLLALIMTPLNFSFWGKLALNFYSHSDASNLIRPLEIDTLQMFQTVFIILGIPLLTGIIFNTRFPGLTEKIIIPIRRISIIIFAAIVIMALANNFDHFFRAIEFVFIIILIHNGIALASGYYFSKLSKLSFQDRKTIAIETGIQNSGLGLALIFNPKIFPPELELGGMAIIAAWWGVWHIISGMTLAGVWSGFTFGIKSKKQSIH